MPRYTPKPVKQIASSKKVCYKSKVVISGKEMFGTPPITCTYDQLSYMTCAISVGGATAAAVSSTGFQAPKATEQYIVDTDNKTFVAFGACLDGAHYMWG